MNVLTLLLLYSYESGFLFYMGYNLQNRTTTIIFNKTGQRQKTQSISKLMMQTTKIMLNRMVQTVITVSYRDNYVMSNAN